jgi:hypothetical protein
MTLEIGPDFILVLKQSKKEYKNNKNKPRGNASFYCIPQYSLFEIYAPQANTFEERSATSRRIFYG